MPANRNALLRYRTIDQCLRNRFRQWTLEDLIDACSDALYEYEGIDKGVSRRTVQLDIQFMRSDKLGYNAPIEVYDRKFYRYSDPEYSITDIPLTDQDLHRLDEVVEILRQFRGFTHFEELGDMVTRLEDKIRADRTQTRRVVEFEKNERLRGLNYLDDLYQAIQNRTVLEVTYQSFKAKGASTFRLYAYLLKEYRNRWFVLGKREGVKNLSTLALDRIESLRALPEEGFLDNREVDLDRYYDDVIGVTVNPGQAPLEVKMWVHRRDTGYVKTKPFHPSQRVLEEFEDGSMVVVLRVQHNIELEREILGYGAGVRVLEPESLRERISRRLGRAFGRYEPRED